MRDWATFFLIEAKLGLRDLFSMKSPVENGSIMNYQMFTLGRHEFVQDDVSVLFN